jgi:23S rRNA pseudouridine2605 synthase
MTDDTPEPPPDAADPAPKSAPKTGDRIAKVLARAGLASRRDAEKLIEAGRVAVNGRIIDSPALDIGPKDRVTVDGQPIPEAEPPRLWLYHKPAGLVTTEKDEEGRPTVFDNLPEGLPRVMSVGRLDITSEGLLLLTNDGEIKRRLELPSTGWLRKYRVRVNGTPDDASLEPLRQGITVDGTAYQPMQVVLDRQQGANAWLTVGLREGKNREVRRAMEAVGLTVNRLIRVSYGPFRLEELEPGQVEEVRPRVLRDQLGLEETPGTSKAGAGKTARTVRALKPTAASAAERPAKPGFAARTGKAGWLADPSASGRPKAGPKGPGKARPIDEPGAEEAPRPRKATGAAAKPRAAGTRSAAATAKGGARPRPAWGDGPRDRAGDGDTPRRGKPPADRSGGDGTRAGKTFGGKPGTQKPWADKTRADRPDAGDSARPDRRPRADAADRSTSDGNKGGPRKPRHAAGDAGPRPSGQRPPRVASSRAEDGDSRARAPRAGTGRPRDTAEDRPRKAPGKPYGKVSTRGAGADGAKGDRTRSEGPRGDRPPRGKAPARGADDAAPRSRGPSDGPRRSTGAAAVPGRGEGAPGPRPDSKPRSRSAGTGPAGGPRSGSATSRGPRTSASKPGGPRSGAPSGAGKPEGARSPGSKPRGPSTGGPKGGPKAGPKGGPRGGSGSGGRGPKRD